MKHPKDRGDRLSKKQNAQHKALFHNGLFKPRVERDKRERVNDKYLKEVAYETDEV